MLVTARKDINLTSYSVNSVKITGSYNLNLKRELKLEDKNRSRVTKENETEAKI